MYVTGPRPRHTTFIIMTTLRPRDNHHDRGVNSLTDVMPGSKEAAGALAPASVSYGGGLIHLTCFMSKRASPS